MKDVNRRMVKGAAWMVLFKLIERSLGLISTIILARLLIPHDFGLVAMATSILAGLELMSAFSFDVVLIQNNRADRSHYDTAWTFNVVFALGCGLLLTLLAWPTAAFYDEPRLQTIMYVLAFATAIQGFENVGVVAFRKEMQFNREFGFMLGKRIASFAVTVPLAFILRDYWALVIGTLIGRIANVGLSYLVHPYRPRLSLAARAELFHFSKWLAINNGLYFLYHRASDFIIGKIAGSQALGLYSISYEISNLPSTELVAPINRAVLPGYSKMLDSSNTLRQGYLNVLSMIALLVVPAGLGIALVAHPLVHVFLGSKWGAAIPLIQMLAGFGVIGALQSNASVVYLALGKPRIMTVLVGLHVIILLPMLTFLCLHLGTEGAALAVLCTALIMLPVHFGVVSRKLRVAAMQFVRILWRPAIAAAAMAAAVNLFLIHGPDADVFSAHLLRLGGAVALGAITYTSTILALWLLAHRPEGAESFLLKHARQRLRPSAPSAPSP